MGVHLHRRGRGEVQRLPRSGVSHLQQQRTAASSGVSVGLEPRRRAWCASSTRTTSQGPRRGSAAAGHVVVRGATDASTTGNADHGFARRVAMRSRVPCRAVERTAVVARHVEGELLGELLLPLLHHRGRDQQQRRLEPCPTASSSRTIEPGFDRLAEADLVGEQVAARVGLAPLAARSRAGGAAARRRGREADAGAPVRCAVPRQAQPQLSAGGSRSGSAGSSGSSCSSRSAGPAAGRPGGRRVIDELLP